MENTNPGLSPEVQQALARRMGQPPVAPTIGQVSPQAAMQQQVMQPMNPSEINAASSPPNISPNQTSQKFQPADRKDLIVKALVEQLENENKADEQRAQLYAAMQPMGGGSQYMSQKIPKLMSEGYPQKQAVAIASSMQNNGGGYGLSPGYPQPMPISQMQPDYMGGMGKDYSGVNNYGKNNQGNGSW